MTMSPPSPSSTIFAMSCFTEAKRFGKSVAGILTSLITAVEHAPVAMSLELIARENVTGVLPTSMPSMISNGRLTG